mmetsp:Transcript_82346/g.150721  ORF Transcript_82346/g.150721 Transcript_82346/m.150721 type:complete len:205 (-) Transcript_82346:1218-1832(-)
MLESGTRAGAGGAACASGALVISASEFPESSSSARAPRRLWRPPVFATFVAGSATGAEKAAASDGCAGTSATSAAGASDDAAGAGAATAGGGAASTAMSQQAILSSGRNLIAIFPLVFSDLSNFRSLTFTQSTKPRSEAATKTSLSVARSTASRLSSSSSAIAEFGFPCLMMCTFRKLFRGIFFAHPSAVTSTMNSSSTDCRFP